MEITRHFTVSTYVVFNNKILLHEHKKLNCLLPLGGHIDRDELPNEAAVREVKEESGLDVTLIDSMQDLGDVKIIPQPVLIALQDINDYHQHIDFAYIAKAKSDDIQPMEGESQSFIWVSKDEIDSIKTKPNVILIMKKVFERLEK